ncbi:uncharacterized protein LAESUDRAFT_720732 [Laetiporus sulphureus 93-53]|uniref:Uncharacterized protein n=1 Tax=Laetiporus sulphureus 93-53 TaxID=1314785 RepID=A0A165HB36_9APHY|nr:uncharacterized protein LAESUDRAFT_720732 [Laetiporus sulphureus 93-53]KZT11490.1 hypothetical protein LAESUDRAFT_720732 [Laetiporus sulphureus 93-53]
MKSPAASGSQETRRFSVPNIKYGARRTTSTQAEPEVAQDNRSRNTGNYFGNITRSQSLPLSLEGIVADDVPEEPTYLIRLAVDQHARAQPWMNADQSTAVAAPQSPSSSPTGQQRDRSSGRPAGDHPDFYQVTYTPDAAIITTQIYPAREDMAWLNIADGERYFNVRPPGLSSPMPSEEDVARWFNPGVIAHEEPSPRRAVVSAEDIPSSPPPPYEEHEQPVVTVTMIMPYGRGGHRGGRSRRRSPREEAAPPQTPHLPSIERFATEPLYA